VFLFSEMKRLANLLLLLCALVSSVLIKNSYGEYNSNEIESYENRRLPNNTIPIRYDLWIKTDIDKEVFNFSGRVKIQVKVVKDSDNVTLHLYKSKVDKIDLLDVNKNLVSENLKFEVNKDLEFLVISLPKVYHQDDKFTLDIQYNGELRDNDVNHGFYRSSYENEDKKRKYYATTQFQMTEARQMMPCYDEPQIRAVIGIEIQHDHSYNAISNMPIKSREIIADTDYVTSKFVDTPPMQTYLVAFVISDFDFISNNDTKVEQRIYANPLAIARGDGELALSIIGPMLKKFEEFFGIEYPLPKIDHAAIDDYRYWAMENFGLFTYRYDFLLHSSEGKGLSNPEREKAVQVLAHEFAHQFFGNLVAPKWWSYVWLNEGFATLYQYMIPEMLFPGKFMDKFQKEAVEKAMSKDSYANQPMSRYVEDFDLIFENFNAIGNQKAAAVLRMFQEAFTVDTFTKGVKYYLNAMKFSAATPDDLHRELQKALNEDQPGNEVDVGEVMRTWEDQAGYPVVTVYKSGNNFVLTQKSVTSGDEIYSIPLTYATKQDPNFSLQPVKTWMKSKVMTIEAHGDDDWMVLDPASTGYFETKYSEEVIEAFVMQLESNDEIIPRSHKLKIMEEIIECLDQLGALKALKSLTFLRRTSDEELWNKGIRIIDLLEESLIGTEMYSKFQNFAQWLTEANLKRLGHEPKIGEPENDSELRSTLIDLSCKLNSMNCMKRELETLKFHLTNPQTQVRLCHGLKLANMSIHRIILENLKDLKYYEIEDFIGCSVYHQIIQLHLNTIFKDSNPLQPFHRLYLLKAIMKRSSMGMRTGLTFIEKNLKKL
jgi:aminopeptidase N